MDEYEDDFANEMYFEQDDPFYEGEVGLPW